MLFLEEVEDVESPNSHIIIEVGLDEIPSTLHDNSLVLHSLALEVNPFHVIFGFKLSSKHHMLR